MERISPLILFPCNATAREALDSLNVSVVFVDDEKSGTTVYGFPVEDRRALAHWLSSRVLAVPGGPKTFRRRKEIIQSLGVDDERWATVVHPSAVVSKYANVGRNVYLGPFATIHAGATIHDHAVVMAGAVVHHDVVVGPYAMLCARAVLAGETTVGEGAFVGAGACVRQQTTIGSGALVGMGACVVDDVAPYAVVAGNPARIIRPK